MIRRFPFHLKMMTLSKTPHCCWEVNGVKPSHELGSSCCNQRAKGSSTQRRQNKSRLKAKARASWSRASALLSGKAPRHLKSRLLIAQGKELASALMHVALGSNRGERRALQGRRVFHEENTTEKSQWLLRLWGKPLLWGSCLPWC